MKVRPVGVELFHAEMRRDGRTEGQTDMRKIIVSFRSLTNVSKNKLLVNRLQCGAVSHSSHILHIL
jgi:hypothetical protein